MEIKPPPGESPALLPGADDQPQAGELDGRPIDSPEQGVGRVRRLKTSSRQMRARAADARQRVEAKRSQSLLIDSVFGGYERAEFRGGGLLAGAIAFRFFLVLVPWVFVIVFGIGIGADASEMSPQDLAQKAGITGLAASAVNASTDVSSLTRFVTLVIASWALLTGAKNLVKTLRGVHALIWGVPLVRLEKPLRAGFGCLGMFVAAMVLTRLVQGLHTISFLGWVVGLALFTLVPAGLWLLCSARFFPRPEATAWRDLLPGSLVFGVGMQLLHLVTVLWAAPSMASKSETYGAIGAALTLLLWAYMLGRLVTLATALNAHLWQRAHPETEAPVEPTVTGGER